MWTTKPEFHPLRLLMLFFVITTIATPINGSFPRKLDDTNVTGPPDTSIKCSSCPTCNNPCSQPPPVLPPPPPPPPPPAPKKPPSLDCPPPPAPEQDCPPPPSSAYLYITGPPGHLYPVDPYFSGDSRSFAPWLPLLMVSGLVGLLASW